MTTIKHIFSAIVFCLLTVLLPAHALGQTVRGRVVDGQNNPLFGVTVTSEKGANSITTDFSGAFTLDVNDGSTRVVFALTGFFNRVEPIGDGPVNVTMALSSFGSDDVVNAGYTSYRKVETTGAISTVYGGELEKSPTITIQETLAGRLPGLTNNETGSDPQSAITQLFARGHTTIRANQTVFIIDGVVFDYAYDELLDMMTSTEIESVSVIKDGASQALYGIQGGDGVIVITTKKGKKGPLRINVKADATIQQVTTTPTRFSSAAYAHMRNQAAYNDNHEVGKNFYYSDNEIAAFASGEDLERYPNTNWYKDYFRPINFFERINMDASGGNDDVTYYANVNFMHQGGMFKNEQDNRFNTDTRLYRINFRTHVDARISRYLSASLNLSGNISRDHSPDASMSSLYETMLNMPPVLNAVTPEILEDGEVLVPGGEVIATSKIQSPLYGRLNRVGYLNRMKTNMFTEVGLKLDMSFITPGLSLSGNMGYRAEITNALKFTRGYDRWVRQEGPLSELGFYQYGDYRNGPLGGGKDRAFLYFTNYRTRLDYNRSFGKHHVSAMAYMFYQHLVKNDTGQPANLPYDRISSGVEASYNYDDRYIVRFDVGYSGSEQYARGARFNLTPGVSAAWVLSNESFMEDADWLSMFKLRASYGITATDRTGLPRFSYLDNVVLVRAPSYFQWEIQEHGVGNPGIRPEMIAKQNYGVDLGLLNQLNISFDWFKERTESMVTRNTSTIPQYYGYSADLYPYNNDGIMENQGYEISVDYHKTIGRDWAFGVGGWFSDARNKVIYTGELARDDDYVYKYRQEGFPHLQNWGYLVDKSNGNGFYNLQDEIDNSPQNTLFTPRVGDLKLRDMNGDGVISDKDAVPLGTGSQPRKFYAFNANVKYRNFELSVLFQGVGMWTIPMTGVRTDPNSEGVFNKLHEKAWTFERFENGEEITFPALTATSSEVPASDFFLYDRSYLRLKNAEIAYNLPESVCKKMKIGSLRLSLSGHNLVTWDKMKTKDFGPEGGGPMAFPVMRLYSFGVKLQF